MSFNLRSEIVFAVCLPYYLIPFFHPVKKFGIELPGVALTKKLHKNTLKPLESSAERGKSSVERNTATIVSSTAPFGNLHQGKQGIKRKVEETVTVDSTDEE